MSFDGAGAARVRAGQLAARLRARRHRVARARRRRREAVVPVAATAAAADGLRLATCGLDGRCWPLRRRPGGCRSAARPGGCRSNAAEASRDRGRCPPGPSSPAADRACGGGGAPCREAGPPPAACRARGRAGALVVPVEVVVEVHPVALVVRGEHPAADRAAALLEVERVRRGDRRRRSRRSACGSRSTPAVRIPKPRGMASLFGRRWARVRAAHTCDSTAPKSRRLRRRSFGRSCRRRTSISKTRGPRRRSSPTSNRSSAATSRPSAVVDEKTRDLLQRTGRGTNEFGKVREQIAEHQGIKVGDETLDYLLDQVVAMLMHSLARRGGLRRGRRPPPPHGADLQEAHGGRHRPRHRGPRADQAREGRHVAVGHRVRPRARGREAEARSRLTPRPSQLLEGAGRDAQHDGLRRRRGAARRRERHAPRRAASSPSRSARSTIATSTSASARRASFPTSRASVEAIARERLTRGRFDVTVRLEGAALGAVTHRPGARPQRLRGARRAARRARARAPTCRSRCSAPFPTSSSRRSSRPATRCARRSPRRSTPRSSRSTRCAFARALALGDDIVAPARHGAEARAGDRRARAATSSRSTRRSSRSAPSGCASPPTSRSTPGASSRRSRSSPTASTSARS